MTIYVDLIWLLNLFFDWMVLLLVCWATKSVHNIKRMALGAVVASLIIPIHLSFEYDWLMSPITKLIYSCFIVLAAFGFKGAKRFWLHMTAFYFINFAIGGAMMAVQFFVIGPDEWLQSSVSPYGDWLSWGVVAILFPIAFMLTKGQLQRLTVNRMHDELYYEVTVTAMGQSVSMTGLLDTGNQLTHPITKRPVILLDESMFEQWFDRDVITRLKESSFEEADTIPETIQWIPFRQAGGDHRLLPVLLVDDVTITTESEAIKTPKVFVGLHTGSLSHQDDAQCLLHPHLFQSKQMRINHVKEVS
ncbi:stage II sporulation protein GA (sporulation sigma-E factor processing peptidase) [Alkalibacillus flavidus]|uniref:Sporulation sigma-E factor-processing peptidase n=1 Tax=Alkalibacillus flavidus TaxID=546021 RepID=A0ABV2KR49_9BACI